jgi:hypothetical protein
VNNLSIQYIKGLSAEALLELERAYPYFLLPKMFRLKKYFSEKHPDYQPLLHKTAIFSFKREALYDFLNDTAQEMIPTPLTSNIPAFNTPSLTNDSDKETTEPKTWLPESEGQEPLAAEVSKSPQIDEILAINKRSEQENSVFSAKTEYIAPIDGEGNASVEQNQAAEINDSPENERDLAYTEPIGKETPTTISTIDTEEINPTEEATSAPASQAINPVDLIDEFAEAPATVETASEEQHPPILEITAGNIKEIEATIYNNIKDLIEPESEPTNEISQSEPVTENIKVNKATAIIQEASENSFLQWLKIVEKKKTIVQNRTANTLQGEAKLKMILGEKTEKINVKKDPELDALEGFVKDQIKRKKKKNPHILEIPFEQTIQMSTEQMDIISEGLAQLLLKQGKFERARAMYQKLILKYPEKSAFFATQIDLIKDLNN